ncbi:MAG TPA: nodulation protein NfeD [Nevskiales bacterium]|nr:nodulation protein NfeD [Nevskiales bacterium]
MSRKQLAAILAAALACYALAARTDPSVPAPAGPSQAALIEIDGAIGPATSLYYESAAARAEESGAALIVLRIDTPGGLDTAMRDIIKRILASKIPVVAYVAPSGARAASAGTYILYASHVAAMAPATNLGAATPVSVIGGPPKSPQPPGTPPDKPGQAPAETPSAAPGPAGAAEERKMVNDAVAYIRSLAEKRGRNAEWAERAVREAASLSAEEALKQKVIDLVARDVEDLLRQLHGRRLQLDDGQRLTLDTRAMTVTRIAPDWRQKILSVLTNPAVAYILLLIGIYGLLLEGYNPGAILPGVIGGICLLLALYAFQVLPINYAGLGLIALGIVLIVAETMVPSLGVLGIGGVVAFVVGSIMLLDTDVPGYQVPIAIIAAIATAAGLVLLLTVTLLLRARKRRVVTGHEAMVGEAAEALEDFDAEGWVRARSETWRARTATPVRRGQKLRVTALDGLVLIVAPEKD